MRLTPAIFLDRDGTINRDSGYTHRISDWQWLPGAVAGLQLLSKAGFALIVCSNQSGIARGYYTRAQLMELQNWASDQLNAFGAPIRAWYYCPHLPDAGCSCRKPRPGMLLQAASDHHLDLSASWMLGDKISDVEAGINAGCQAALVSADNQEIGQLLARHPRASVFRGLEAAANYIIARKDEAAC